MKAFQPPADSSHAGHDLERWSGDARSYTPCELQGAPLVTRPLPIRAAVCVVGMHAVAKANEAIFAAINGVVAACLVGPAAGLEQRDVSIPISVNSQRSSPARGI